jgi:ribosomal protein S18 acetylase RimI-like enzyme
MQISLCTKADFDRILTDFIEFWGDERTKNLHNPVFLYEFGNTAYVAKEGDKVVGYLFGLFSQTAPVAYVKFIGVRRAYQQRGLGRQLYAHFTEFARTKGYKELKAITSPDNMVSIAFHRSIGMELLGEPNEAGIPVVKDYGGPGIDRVVFRRKI